jgi:transposase InsO family protein
MTSRVVWRGMTSNIARWVRDCQHCSRGKVTSQPAAPVQPIQVPARRFSHIHVDLVGPLPVAADGSTYLLTIIDRSTRWLEPVSLRNMETTTCVEALISTWVSRYGVPSNITTDRGRQFTSTLWSGLCQKLGVTHITTTAYHPQSHGMVERAHRQIKDALRACLAGVEWPQHLPWVLLGLRAAPKEDTAISSAELVFGAALTLPGQFLATMEQSPATYIKQLQTSPTLPTRPATYAEAAASVPEKLMKAEYVFVRRGGVVPPLASVPRAVQGAAGRRQVLHHQPRRPRGHGLG